MRNLDELKQQAAQRAIDYVQSGMALGLGTGSTARYALEELGQRLADGRLHTIVGVPTSEYTASLARQLDIPLTTLDAHPALDLAIDGADEIDPHLNLIKGQGGALLREKIVAAAAQTLLIIADHTKLVAQLGTRFPLPIEVIPMAVPTVTNRLQSLGGNVALRHGTDGKPFRTDEGNHILDYTYDPIPDPIALDTHILHIPGVVDHGLFLGMAEQAIIADPDGIQVITR